MKARTTCTNPCVLDVSNAHHYFFYVQFESLKLAVHKFKFKLAKIHSEKSSWWMLERPDEDSQVRDTADIWRVDATDIKLNDLFFRTSSG